jgi:hypothetical protein
MQRSGSATGTSGRGGIAARRVDVEAMMCVYRRDRLRTYGVDKLRTLRARRVRKERAGDRARERERREEEQAGVTSEATVQTTSCDTFWVFVLESTAIDWNFIPCLRNQLLDRTVGSTDRASSILTLNPRYGIPKVHRRTYTLPRLATSITFPPHCTYARFLREIYILCYTLISINPCYNTLPQENSKDPEKTPKCHPDEYRMNEPSRV